MKEDCPPHQLSTEEAIEKILVADKLSAELRKLNPHIPMSCWISSYLRSIAQAYAANSISYEHLIEDMNLAFKAFEEYLTRH